MKCFAVLAALSLASAAPLAGADAKSEAAPVAVAEGAPVITGDWEPVDAAEVRSIMAGRSATSPLQKRTPGGICKRSTFFFHFSADLPMEVTPLYQGASALAC